MCAILILLDIFGATDAYTLRSINCNVIVMQFDNITFLFSSSVHRCRHQV